MDLSVVITLVISSVSLMTSILTHVKYSECWGFKLKTRNQKSDSPSPLDTPSSPLLPQTIKEPHW